jgi:hypothetical protein
MEQSVIAWYLGAFALGLFFSYLVVVVYRRIVPANTSRRYWSEVAKGIHGILAGDVEQYWSHYVAVITQTGRFVARQIVGIALAFAPLVVALFMAGPWFFARWDSGAAWEVIPSTAGDLVADADGKPGRSLAIRDGPTIALPGQPGATAVCQPDSLACLTLSGFGFKTVAVDEMHRGDRALIVVRTAHDDWNLLWPYFSDPEFIFFATLSLGSLLLFLRKPRRVAASASDYSISLVDYVLTQTATATAGLMHRIGDWETKAYRRRIGHIAISEPIFIAGLARSGTTILLEKLATIDGVATHRYRDFPFIMTPILWNRFLNVFGAKQNPIERPHRDGIRITRESPDAFEEPVWQYHFPGLHNPERQHRLTAAGGNSAFSAFYRDHIRKILWVRHGNRYLSKGNYNLPRIELIASIFPDARFLIPVRHPISHVESLTRQHRLFMQYSERDPKVPAYLRAVGHYEFGPQRLAISLREQGARAITQAWDQGQDALGYARQWADVYGFVAGLRSDNPKLAERIRVVRFEDLCGDPEREFRQLLEFTHLDVRADSRALAAGIVAPAHRVQLPDAEVEACWQAVATIAGEYGYTRDVT